jgi:hypothetical protein
MAKQDHQPTLLERLIAEPKGKTTYTANQAFLLHVFWECPSSEAAHTLLSALERCAHATRRDTPCVPVYFFRISSNNASLLPPAPTTVAEHPALQAAQRKIRMGVARGAVEAELVRAKLDAGLLDLEPSAELPVELRQEPVAVEFTELYLDERAFNEHAGSRDYLAAYGAVMEPSVRTRVHTMRLGTPTANLVETILGPMLREDVAPLGENAYIWRKPVKSDAAVMISLDLSILQGQSPEESVDRITALAPKDAIVSIAFQHPLRSDTIRYLAVVPDLSVPRTETIRAWPLQRGEIHCNQDSEDRVKQVIITAELADLITVNPGRQVGYIRHEKARELVSL